MSAGTHSIGRWSSPRRRPQMSQLRSSRLRSALRSLLRGPIKGRPQTTINMILHDPGGPPPRWQRTGRCSSATVSKLDQMYNGVYNEGASCWLDGRAASSTTAGSINEEVSSDSSSVSHLAQLGRFDDQAQPCSHKVHALRREVLEETVGKTIRP